MAAGKGERLKIRRPKALLELSGKCLVDFPIEETNKFVQENSLKAVTGVVIGHLKAEIENYLEKKYSSSNIKLQFAFQKKQVKL